MKPKKLSAKSTQPVAKREPVFEFENTGEERNPQLFINLDDSIDIVERGKSRTVTMSEAVHWVAEMNDPHSDLAKTGNVREGIRCNRLLAKQTDWIEALVKSGDGPVTRKIDLTLSTSDWAMVAEGAAVNGWTLDEVVEHLFESQTNVCDWFNEGHKIPTEADLESQLEALHKVLQAGERALAEEGLPKTLGNGVAR